MSPTFDLIRVRYPLRVTLLVWCLFSWLLPGQTPPIPGQNTEIVQGSEVAGRSVIVKFAPGSSPNLVQAQLAHDLDFVQPLNKNNDLFLFHSRSKDVPALLKAVGAGVNVRYVEPDPIIRSKAVPNDPGFNQLWGMAQIGAPLAWDSSTGSLANVIAVVDTGIDYTHPDLAANLWSAPAPFTVTVGGIPIACPAGSHGFNAITNTCDPMDDNNHGTHVSGTLGAVGNNGLGVTGVNWITRIMGLKFIAANGSGDVAAAVRAMDFAIQVKAQFAGTGTPVNVRVFSNSWGGTGFSQTLLDEINAANGSDILFVAAAGNSSANNDSTPFYPASYGAPNLIAVAATDNNDNLASFSDYGPRTVHLAAPGVNILSTVPGAAYAFYSGTSMATPHVSGAAMLLLAACNLNTAALKSALLNNVDVLASLAGRFATGGRLNVAKAMQACVGTPPPASLAAISVSSNSLVSGQSASATVTLTGPAGAGGATVSLASSYPAGIGVPAAITIPQGASAASFNITAGIVSNATPVTLTASYAGVSRTAGLTINPAPSTARASFIAIDSVTQGNWKLKYGADGYTVVDDSVKNPSYGSVTPSQQADYVWTGSTSDVRALQRASGNDRIAAVWYANAFQMDFNPTDQVAHQIAIYCLDWSFENRVETISVVDAATNAVLDSRSISNFTNGVYLVWNVTGHVVFRVNLNSGSNAVVNGIFFGAAGSAPPPPPPASASASFLNTDTTTQGNWKLKYGADGYTVVDDSVKNPSYGSVTPSQQLDYVWTGSTSDVRALQRASGADRIAAVWYANSFQIDFNPTDAVAHQIAIYCLDWSFQNRVQTISVVDAATNAVLDSRNISNFTNGVYLVWNVTGHVVFRVNLNSGSNAVVNGIFLGAAGGVPPPPPPASASASFLNTDTTTQGNWKSNYGSDGYTVVDDSVKNPGYASVTPSQQADYVWTGSTSDVRALQRAVGADRIASVWYGNSFQIDFNPSDAVAHRIALYCLDWSFTGRAETISIVDANTNAVLDTRRISNFTNGVYLVWNVTGHVVFRINLNSGDNAVVNGIFFGAAGTSSTGHLQ